MNMGAEDNTRLSLNGFFDQAVLDIRDTKIKVVEQQYSPGKDLTPIPYHTIKPAKPGDIDAISILDTIKPPIEFPKMAEPDFLDRLSRYVKFDIKSVIGEHDPITPISIAGQSFFDGIIKFLKRDIYKQLSPVIINQIYDSQSIAINAYLNPEGFSDYLDHIIANNDLTLDLSAIRFMRETPGTTSRHTIAAAAKAGTSGLELVLAHASQLGAKNYYQDFPKLTLALSTYYDAHASFLDGIKVAFERSDGITNDQRNNANHILNSFVLNEARKFGFFQTIGNLTIEALREKGIEKESDATIDDIQQALMEASKDLFQKGYLRSTKDEADFVDHPTSGMRVVNCPATTFLASTLKGDNIMKIYQHIDQNQEQYKDKITQIEKLLSEPKPEAQKARFS